MKLFKSIKEFIDLFKIIFNMTLSAHKNNKNLIIAPVNDINYETVNKSDWYKICRLVSLLYMNRQKLIINYIGTKVDNFYGANQFTADVCFITQSPDCIQNLNKLFMAINNDKI